MPLIGNPRAFLWLEIGSQFFRWPTLLVLEIRVLFLAREGSRRYRERKEIDTEALNLWEKITINKYTGYFCPFFPSLRVVDFAGL